MKLISSKAHRPRVAAPNKRETRRIWPRPASPLCASSSKAIRLLCLAGLTLTGLQAAATDADTEYHWRILPHLLTGGGNDRVNLTLTWRRAHLGTVVTTTDVPLSSLHGLEAGDLWGGPVSFHIRRDAGTLQCKGSFIMGVGNGIVRFEPDPHFVADLKAMGLSVSEEELAPLAFEDVRLSTISDLRAACPCVRTLDDVRELTNHGVSGRFLRQVAQLSTGNLDVEDITAMKDHGVQTSLLEALKYGGYQIPVKSVVELQDHGVNAAFVRAMAPQCKSDRSAQNLIALHDHGVSAEFVRGVQEAGMTPSTDEIIQMHDHGIDPKLLRAVKDSGIEATPSAVANLHDHGVDLPYVRGMQVVFRSKLSVDSLVELHDHGVSLEFARQISESGFALSDSRQLIQLHEHGVPVELAAEVARSHRSGWSSEDLIKLHEHGVDSGFIKSFDAAGYSGASVNELIELHDHGVTADYAHRLQAEGFGVLPVSKLIQMKDHGV